MVGNGFPNLIFHDMADKMSALHNRQKGTVAQAFCLHESKGKEERKEEKTRRKTANLDINALKTKLFRLH